MASILTPVILVLGYSGTMGQRIVRLLQVHMPDAKIIGGNRHPSATAAIPTRHINYADETTFASGLTGIDILIHAAGPFQHNPAPLVRACIERRIHYIDIAESLEFINQVRATAATFTDCPITLVPGCSTVPGLVNCLINSFPQNQLINHLGTPLDGRSPIAHIDIRLNLGSANPLSAGLLFSLLRPLGQSSDAGHKPWFRQLFTFTHMDGRIRQYGNYPVPLNNPIVFHNRSVGISFAVGFDFMVINVLLYLASFILPHLSDRALLKLCLGILPPVNLIWGNLFKLMGGVEGRLTLVACGSAHLPIEQIELRATANGLDIPAITAVWAAQKIVMHDPLGDSAMRGCVGLEQLISGNEVIQRLTQEGYIINRKIYD
ncbi:MAG: saccharopine dehydrogenase NADP-binding domain-containing protein [Candidatus Nitrotoga sp.]